MVPMAVKPLHGIPALERGPRRVVSDPVAGGEPPDQCLLAVAELAEATLDATPFARV